MIGIEIVLLLAGAMTFTMSFLLPSKDNSESQDNEDPEAKREKLKAQIESLMNMNEEEIRRRMREIVDEEAGATEGERKRNLEKLTNEKIMAVDEYSRTVLDAIEKNHKEVVFLYDMLNNKSTDLKNTIRKAEQTRREVEAERAAEEQRAQQITIAARALREAEDKHRADVEALSALKAASKAEEEAGPAIPEAVQVIDEKDAAEFEEKGRRPEPVTQATPIIEKIKQLRENEKMGGVPQNLAPNTGSGKKKKKSDVGMPSPEEIEASLDAGMPIFGLDDEIEEEEESTEVPETLEAAVSEEIQEEVHEEIIPELLEEPQTEIVTDVIEDAQTADEVNAVEETVREEVAKEEAAEALPVEEIAAEEAAEALPVEEIVKEEIKEEVKEEVKEEAAEVLPPEETAKEPEEAKPEVPEKIIEKAPEAAKKSKRKEMSASERAMEEMLASMNNGGRIGAGSSMSAMDRLRKKKEPAPEPVKEEVPVNEIAAMPGIEEIEAGKIAEETFKEEIPQVEVAAVVDEIPQAEEAAVIDEFPQAEEAAVIDEFPQVEEIAASDEISQAEEAAVMEELPQTEEIPVTDGSAETDDFSDIDKILNESEDISEKAETEPKVSEVTEVLEDTAEETHSKKRKGSDIVQAVADAVERLAGSGRQKKPSLGNLESLFEEEFKIEDEPGLEVDYDPDAEKAEDSIINDMAFEVPSEETAIEEAVAEEAPVEEVPMEEAVAEEVSMEEEPTEEAPDEDLHIDDSLKETVLTDMFLGDLTKDEAAEEMPAESEVHEILHEAENEAVNEPAILEEEELIPQPEEKEEQEEKPRRRRRSAKKEMKESDDVFDFEELSEPVSISLSGMSRNEQVLAMHHDGKKEVEIAKALTMGVGEVKLVIELYDREKSKGGKNVK